MDLKAIGRRIKIAREQKGLTQEALAELLDLTPMHISVIERGFKPTKLETFSESQTSLVCPPTPCCRMSLTAPQILFPLSWTLC